MEKSKLSSDQNPGYLLCVYLYILYIYIHVYIYIGTILPSFTGIILSHSKDPVMNQSV